LAIIQEKGGQPDINNYTMIVADRNAEGTIIVRVQDCQDGKENVLDNTGKYEAAKSGTGPLSQWGQRSDWDADSYEHLLTGEQYSLPFNKTNKKFRIFRDNPAGFFHFYYAVKKTIRGKEAQDWSELLPSRDWANPNQKYFVALVAHSNGKALFDDVSALIKPEVDQSDVASGFKAVQREYNWSGFFGDAVVVSFGDAFKYREKDIKFVF
jgi:hypothetical protein